MTAPSSKASKAQWRQWAQEVRRELPVAELSAQLVRQLRGWETYQNAHHVLSYMVFGDELDLRALSNDDKTFYVTRTWKKPSLRLTVHRLDAGLERHPFGYWQPPADAEPVAPNRLDLVLVPGLCFNEGGVRIGYGAGYYDRFLSSLHPEVPRVGITVEALVVPRLPRQEHDSLMTQLATEKGIRAINSQG